MFDFIVGIITLLSAPRMGITILAALVLAAAALSLGSLWPWTGFAAGFLTLAGIVLGWRWESSAAKRKTGDEAGPSPTRPGQAGD